MVHEFSPSCLVAPVLEQLVQMAEIIEGWSCASFLRLQNKGCQTEGIAKSVVAVESGWTGKSGARGRLIGRKGRGLRLGALQGQKPGLRGGGTETM